MIITFESGPLKGKIIEVVDSTLEYDVDMLPLSLPRRIIDPSEPVKTVRLRYRRSEAIEDGAVVFCARSAWDYL